MATGLLFHNDEVVASYVYASPFCSRRMAYDRAIGLVDANGQLIGGVLFQNWNGFNVEGSYYGERTLTPGIVKVLARFILFSFSPSRVTVITSKRNKRLLRALRNIGFKDEGTQKRFYGDRDCTKNTGVRLVIFKERLRVIAGYKDADNAATGQRRPQIATEYAATR